MNSVTPKQMCSRLVALTTTLESDAALSVMIDAVEQLPDLISAFNESVSNIPARTDAVDLSAVGTLLSSLQESLMRFEKRLYREQDSIRVQLHELAAQREWAQLSRQSG